MNDTEMKPNHVIIWLDANMGVARNNRPSKKDLANNTNLDSLPSDERSLDIDNFIHSVDQNMNNENFHDLIKNPLRMFTDKTECIKCINDSIEAKKQIFLIVSGTMGQLIVPEIDSILSGFIYIFCGDTNKHLDTWACNHLDHIIMFDDETDLFVRLLRDIGKYYKKKSEEASANQTNSIEYLKWAQRLVLRANKKDQIGGQKLLKEINDKLASLELLQSNENDGNDQIGKDVDEG